MNYEFNQLHHVGVVAKRVRVSVAHEGDDNTPSGPRGKNPLVSMIFIKKIIALRVKDTDWISLNNLAKLDVKNRICYVQIVDGNISAVIVSFCTLHCT